MHVFFPFENLWAVSIRTAHPILSSKAFEKILSVSGTYLKGATGTAISPILIQNTSFTSSAEAAPMSTKRSESSGTVTGVPFFMKCGEIWPMTP